MAVPSYLIAFGYVSPPKLHAQLLQDWDNNIIQFRKIHKNQSEDMTKQQIYDLIDLVMLKYPITVLSNPSWLSWIRYDQENYKSNKTICLSDRLMHRNLEYETTQTYATSSIQFKLNVMQKRRELLQFTYIEKQE